jgi:O-antigen ligase
MINLKKNYDSIKYIIFIFLIFTLAAPMFNAVNSIVMAISVIFVILQYKRISLKAIPLSIVYAIFLFISSLFISSFFIDDKKSIDYAFKFLYWMLPFFVVFYGFQLCKNINIPLYSFTMALLVSAGAVLYQYYFLDKLRPGGLYFQPNHFASMMDILFPFATMFVLKNLYECKNNIIGVILFLPTILGIYALFLSGSRGGLIGIFIGLLLTLICYYLRKQKIIKFIAVFFGILILMVSSLWYAYNSFPDLFQRGYDNERLLLIESSYNMWNDHKLFGVGLDNWEEVYNNKYKLPQARENLDMPHNILAFFFSTTGILGGIGYIIFTGGIFVFLIKHLHKYQNKQIIFIVLAMIWALLSINIHGMVDIGLNNKFVMRLFSGSLGLTVAYLYAVEQSGDCENDKKKC